MLDDTLIRPVSPIGQLLWGQHIRAYDAGVNHQYREEAARTGRDEIEVALSRMQEPAQHQLDELTRPLASARRGMDALRQSFTAWPSSRFSPRS